MNGKQITEPTKERNEEQTTTIQLSIPTKLYEKMRLLTILDGVSDDPWENLTEYIIFALGLHADARADDLTLDLDHLIQHLTINKEKEEPEIQEKDGLERNRGEEETSALTRWKEKVPAIEYGDDLADVISQVMFPDLIEALGEGFYYAKPEGNLLVIGKASINYNTESQDLQGQEGIN